MAYDVKFIWASGKRLAFSAYEQDGTGRGSENQPMRELRNRGYYFAEPATDLEDGDMVSVFELEILEWEDDGLYFATEEYMYYEEDVLYWEGNPLFDTDTSFTDDLIYASEPIGSGEFTFGSGDVSDLTDNVEELLDGQGTVINTYDETTDGVGGGTTITSLGVIATHDGGDC